MEAGGTGRWVGRTAREGDGLGQEHRHDDRHDGHDGHDRARRPRLRDTDIVPHQSVAPDGAPLPEVSQEALHELRHPRIDDVDGWYYEQPPFDLGWVLGPDGFDRAPGERTRPRPRHRPDGERATGTPNTAREDGT